MAMSYARTVHDSMDRPAPAKAVSFQFLPPDLDIVGALFPFRMVLRNGAVFLLRSRQFDGPVATYRHAETQVRKMYADRGYYFIEDQSRFLDTGFLPASTWGMTTPR